MFTHNIAPLFLHMFYIKTCFSVQSNFFYYFLFLANLQSTRGGASLGAKGAKPHLILL
jgi:hypothetical protein